MAIFDLEMTQLSTLDEVPWGSSGQTVYERTYSRKRPDGTQENWVQTVTRVVDGNLKLVDPRFHEPKERDKLINLMLRFKILPAGRHLWMSGILGRQFLFNCHHAGWSDDVSEHFSFMFNQLMQGGGVGSNYSNQYIEQYPPVTGTNHIHIVCDPEHPDYESLREILSGEYSHEWDGAIRVEDSREGWIQALCEVLNAHFTESENAQPLVFDVGLIRHRGSRIKTFGGTAAGPGPLALLLSQVSGLLNQRAGQRLTSQDVMLIDHYIANCVVSGNVRRSARMSIKNWKDSDIFEFISCKEDHLHHWSTNISVEIDDEFFSRLRRRDPHASRVYAAVVDGMLRNGEPGFYNRSLAQVGEINDVPSTNPCGEIALESWENCNLGHVNLDAFFDNFEAACEAHRLMTRFLIRATFGDVAASTQREVVDRNRRIGVGHFGFHGWLVKQGIRFSDAHRDFYVQKTLRDFYEVVRKEARRYSFQLRIPEPIKVTTVAPTGTIAKLPGKSEGIHPIYARYFVRRIRFSDVDPDQRRQVEEFRAQGYPIEDCLQTLNTKVVAFPTKDSLVSEVEEMGLDAESLVESANEIDLADMLAVQAMYQECYADNAVSFTVNIEPGKYSDKQVADILIHYLPKLKGTTIMVDNSRPQSPYERISREAYELSALQTVADGVDENCASGACPIK